MRNMGEEFEKDERGRDMIKVSKRMRMREDSPFPAA